MEWRDILKDVLGTVISAAFLGVATLLWRLWSSEPVIRKRIYEHSMRELLGIRWYECTQNRKIRRLFRDPDVRNAMNDPGSVIIDQWEAMCRKAREVTLSIQPVLLFRFFERVRIRMYNNEKLKSDALRIFQQMALSYSSSQEFYHERAHPARLPSNFLPLATSLPSLGFTPFCSSQYEQAEKYYQDALQAAESLPDAELQNWIRIDMGSLRVRQGELARRGRDYQEARRRYREALRLARQTGDADLRRQGLVGFSSLLDERGELASERGDYEEAERLYRAALAIARKIPEPAMRDDIQLHIGWLQIARGKASQRRGDDEMAKRHYGEALKTAEELGEAARPLQARAHTHLGLLYAAQQHRDEARGHLTTAMSLETVETAMRLTDEVVGLDEELGAELKWLLAPRAEKVKREYALELLADALEIYERLGDGRAHQVRTYLERMQGVR